MIKEYEFTWGDILGHVPIEMVIKMKSVGFSFVENEHFLNLGVVFYYQGKEHYIGGTALDEFTEKEKEIAAAGIWLPSDEDLLDWLNLVSFDVFIERNHDTKIFQVKAVDKQTGYLYRAGHSDLAYALAKIVYSICKEKCRPYIPEEQLRLKIDRMD